MTLVRLLRTGKGPIDGWMARAYDRGVQAAFREIVPPLVADLGDRLTGVRRALDVGCGPGQFTIALAESFPEVEVVGVDLAPTMIELARDHAARSPARDRLHFQVADAAALPFDDASFDVVLSSGSIKHWPDPMAGVREMFRVLVPGGRAFIGEMNRAVPREAMEAQRQRIRHWLFRLIYPRVFTKALDPEEAERLFAASPFGPPVDRRMLLDGCFWLFELAKPPAASGEVPGGAEGTGAGS